MQFYGAGGGTCIYNSLPSEVHVDLQFVENPPNQSSSPTPCTDPVEPGAVVTNIGSGCAISGGMVDHVYENGDGWFVETDQTSALPSSTLANVYKVAIAFARMLSGNQ